MFSVVTLVILLGLVALLVMEVLIYLETQNQREAFRHARLEWLEQHARQSDSTARWHEATTEHAARSRQEALQAQDTVQQRLSALEASLALFASQHMLYNDELKTAVQSQQWTADGSRLDVVIPLGPRDYEVAGLAVRSLFQHCLGLRRIYLISASDPRLPGTVWVPESQFPFSLAQLETEYEFPASRSGWYLQQLLKMYAAEVIPDLLDWFLVWDADTWLLHDQVFVQKQQALFSTSEQHHPPYFEHMQHLLPQLTRQTVHSGIVNFMVFHRWALKRLRTRVEQHHPSQPFWATFLLAVSPERREASGASEFELYFHYMCQFEPEHFVIRNLRIWQTCPDEAALTDQVRAQYDVVSCHWYVRPSASSRGAGGAETVGAAV